MKLSSDYVRVSMWPPYLTTGAVNRGGELQGDVSDSVRFIASSESYITIDKGSLSASSKFNLKLKFRTFNKDGIIFFLGQDISDGSIDKPDYFKLYMKDGLVCGMLEFFILFCIKVK